MRNTIIYTASFILQLINSCICPMEALSGGTIHTQ